MLKNLRRGFIELLNAVFSVLLFCQTCVVVDRIAPYFCLISRNSFI